MFSLSLPLLILILIIIIIAIITIVIFLIRVQFKLTYIFYTKKKNYSLFVLYQVNAVNKTV